MQVVGKQKSSCEIIRREKKKREAKEMKRLLSVACIMIKMADRRAKILSVVRYRMEACFGGEQRRSIYRIDCVQYM